MKKAIILSGMSFGLTICFSAIAADFDGDGTNDIGIFRESSGLWAIQDFTRIYFGHTDDWPLPGDYDGDGSLDISIFRPSSGLWAIRNLTRAYYGGYGDEPLMGLGVAGGGGQWSETTDGIYFSDKVGIGTDSPSTALEVKGTVTADDFSGSGASLIELNAWNITTGTVDSDRVEFGEYFIDSAGSPGQVWKSDGDGAGYWGTGTGGGGSLWAESGSDIYYSAGNVGIGTTSPARKLEVNGSGRFASVEAPIIYAGHSAAGRAYFDGGFSSYITAGGYGHNYPLQFWVGNSATAPKMIINSAGNVGIGTTDPSQELEIRKDVVGRSDLLQLSNRATPNVGNTAGILFAPYSSSFNARIEAIAETAGAATGLGFWTHTGGEFAERVRIKNNGNVGIGTTSPGRKLDVAGDANFLGPVVIEGTDVDSYFKWGADEDLYLRPGKTTGTTIIGAGNAVNILSNGNVGIGTTIPGAQLHIKEATSATWGMFLENSVGSRTWALSVDQTTDDGKFVVRDFTAAATRMVIDNSGNVGIGTTSPGAKLDVNGTAEINGTLDMKQNAVKNMVIETLAANPPSPVQGQIWLVSSP